MNHDTAGHGPTMATEANTGLCVRHGAIQTFTGRHIQKRSPFDQKLYCADSTLVSAAYSFAARSLLRVAWVWDTLRERLSIGM